MAAGGEKKDRRAYAKGEARRAEILTAALEAFAEQGYRGSSLRDIAADTGVSASGILHHFGSKDALLTAVLEERERLNLELLPPDAALTGAAEYFRNLVAYNSTQPGLVRLFATLAAEAADPEHPAHAWFVKRYAGAREHVRTVLDEDLAPLEEAEREATVQLFMAVSDGLQTQWLLEPDRDMKAGMDRFVDLYAQAKQHREVPETPGATEPGSRPVTGAGRLRQLRLGPKGVSAADRLESFGHHGRLADGRTPASFEAETEAACAALGAALAKRGSGWDDVTEIRTLHAELTNHTLETVGRVLQTRTGKRDIPWLAQAAPELAHDGLRIELAAVALPHTNY
ncbi:TetR family transcriptional regulator [Streptomyces sp. NPDC050535]|uniref:TetR family transcriptional regulator n=1 Tax=Streptomyces sp. NPDC050535 TaxID=3365626 RepID=UPI0037AEC0D7